MGKRKHKRGAAGTFTLSLSVQVHRDLIQSLNCRPNFVALLVGAVSVSCVA